MWSIFSTMATSSALTFPITRPSSSTLVFLAAGDGGGLLLAIFCPPSIAVGTAIGGLYGAVVAEPKAEVEKAEAAFKKSLADIKIQQALGERIFEHARARTPHTFKLLLDQGPSIVNENPYYRPLASHGIDTIVETNVLKVELVGEGCINPPLHVHVTVRVRLIRAADNTSLYEGKFDYSSKDHNLTKWAANDAQLFREVVARANEVLSGEIVDELFLL